jgi:hypothetical protein
MSLHRLGLAAVGLAMAVAMSTPARADIDGDLFTRTVFSYEVQLVTPKNWIPSEERSYPSIILWLTRREPPGRMVLSAERIDRRESSLAYAERTRSLLRTLGYRVRRPRLHAQTGAYWIDFDHEGTYLRQAFLVVGDVGFALTLSANDSRTRGQHLRSFDAALRTLSVRPASAPSEEASSDT